MRSFGRIARRGVVLATVLASLTSCSIFQSDLSASIPATNPTPPPEWSVTAISSSPHTYKITNGKDSPPFFMTTIRDCSSKSDRLSGSANALARQLLVGLKDVEIYRKEGKSDGALHWLLSGAVDEDPVLIASYLITAEACLKDVVLWTFPEKSTDVSLKDQASVFAARITDLSELIEDQLSSGAAQ